MRAFSESAPAPAAPAALLAEVEPTLDRWLIVQRAVRESAEAARAGDTERARVELARALAELGPDADPDVDGDRHLEAQRAMLADVRDVLSPSPTLTPDTTRYHVPSSGEAYLEHCPTIAREGDVVCLLTIRGEPGRYGAEDGIIELAARVRSSVRSSDQVRVVDDQRLVVVLDQIPVPVAWRRMSALVGERPAVGAAAPRVVRAGIARVGLAGACAALEAAYAALCEPVTGARSWIVLADVGHDGARLKSGVAATDH